jgi:hypothetical protein
MAALVIRILRPIFRFKCDVKGMLNVSQTLKQQAEWENTTYRGYPTTNIKISK